MEARGGTVEQIAASTPSMWQPNVAVIHDERRVYQDDKQIAGPVLEARATEAAACVQSEGNQILF